MLPTSLEFLPKLPLSNKLGTRNANNANAITTIIKAERCLIFAKTAIFIVVYFIFSLRKYNYLRNNYKSRVIFYKKFYFSKKNQFLIVILTNSIFLFVASSIIK